MNHHTRFSLSNLNGVSEQFRDVAFGSGRCKASEVVIKQKPCKEYCKMGTWNVRTMLKDEKLENVKQEMQRYGMNILGLSEVRWKEYGDLIYDGLRVIYSGGKESQRGVALILDKEMAQRVIKVVQHNDRIILVKLKTEPVNMIIIQVYMPTSAYTEEEVDSVYDELENLIDNENGNGNIMVMGDWNAAVGEKEG